MRKIVWDISKLRPTVFFFFSPCSQILLPEQYLEITTLVSVCLALIFQEKGKQI